MRSPPTENVEGVADGPSQVVTDCLCTPLILRKILQHCSNPQLFQLSLVSKFWNHEARSVLRRRGKSAAFIRTSHPNRHPCQRLISFASDLRRMNVVPFSGIVLELNLLCRGSEACLGSLATELDEDPSYYDVILNQLHWKQLVVMFPHNWEGCKDCPAFPFVRKILNKASGVLELLTLDVPSEEQEFIQQFLQDSSFPRLKTLSFLDDYGSTTDDYTSLIKALVSRAPNLKMLRVFGRANWSQNLLEGSSAILETYHQVSPCSHEISDNVLGSLQLKSMKLRAIHRNLSLQRINMAIPIILKTSCMKLSSLHIDVLYLAPLMCYGIRLCNVRDFKMYLNPLSPLQPRMRKLVTEFDFTRIFPSLNYVQSVVYPLPNARLHGQINIMVEGCNPDLKDPLPDRAVNIKSLTVSILPTTIERISAGILPKMLPHVERLNVTQFRGEIMPSLIWENQWADLNELQVVKEGRSISSNMNLDSVFCGIFPAEVAELREKDEEYLKAVNIVPVMPSFVCLKGLRTFTLSGDRAYFFRGVNADPGVLFGSVIDPAHMFSKVTGLIAFKRCPTVSVTLKSFDDEVVEALSHMRNYARVVNGDE